MDQRMQVRSMLVAEGEGVLDLKDRLSCSLGRFYTLGARQGDGVRLTTPDGKEAYGRVLQVASDTTLVLDGLPEVGFVSLFGGGDQVFVKAEVLRLVGDTCGVCELAGKTAESDHRHCLMCNAEMAIAPEGAPLLANCDDCIKAAREKLLRTNTIARDFSLFGGKLKVSVHSRTIEEGDFIQEWQDQFKRELGGRTTAFFFDEVAKSALAIVLDNDGEGGRPMAIAPEDMDAKQAVPLAMKHFKDFPESRYKLTLSCMSRIDKLVEEACFYRIEDKSTKDELMELAEQLATSKAPVTGVVKLWDGLEALTFCDPKKERADEADAFAELIIANYRQHGGPGAQEMSDARKTFTKSVCRLAAKFVGDSKGRFTPETPFQERLTYLMTLPIPLYYLYIAAVNVWDARVVKAGSVEVVGNF